MSRKRKAGYIRYGYASDPADYAAKPDQKGINMDPKPIGEPVRMRKAEAEPPPRQQLDLVASSFQELFTLLEEYAPIWYTEQHHKRAIAAQRVLRKL